MAIYNLEVVVDGVEKQESEGLIYRHSLTNKRGRYRGVIYLPDPQLIGTLLQIVVMVE